MESSRLENIIKDVRSLFRLNKIEKETSDVANKGKKSF